MWAKQDPGPARQPGHVTAEPPGVRTTQRSLLMPPEDAPKWFRDKQALGDALHGWVGERPALLSEMERPLERGSASGRWWHLRPPSK